MIRDENIEWLQKKIYIPYISWTSMSQVKATPTGLGSWGAAATTMATAGPVANFGAVPLVAADVYNHLLMIPYDLDRTKAARFRIAWSATAGAQAQTFTLVYGLYNHPARALRASGASTTPGATATASAITTPATALDTVIPATTSSGANFLEWTDVGIINRNTLTDQAYFIGLKMTITATAGTAVWFGMEMQYSPRKTIGPRRNILGGKRVDDHLGVQWTDGRQEGL